jgi:hypothetical protein
VSGVAIVAICRRTARTTPERSRRQLTAIVVGEAQPMTTKLTPQQAVLFDQVRDGLALPSVEPAGQSTEHHLHRHDVDHKPSLYHAEGRSLSAET